MKKIALTIAGFDPSGGAGILLDTKVFNTEGIFPMAVITSIVPQNSRGVFNFFPLQKEGVRESLKRLFEDFNIKGIKIGVIGSIEIIETISDFLEYAKKIPIVYDPVLYSGNSVRLYNNNEFIENIKKKIIKKTTLITPNIRELEILTETKINDEERAIKSGKILFNKYKTSVLVKGGHLKGNDFLITEDDVFTIKGDIIKKDVHGTGCMLSSLILAFLMKDLTLEEAVLKAKNKITEKINKSLILGKGNKNYMEI